jgi:hypothetical protein
MVVVYSQSRLRYSVLDTKSSLADLSTAYRTEMHDLHFTGSSATAVATLYYAMKQIIPLQLAAGMLSKPVVEVKPPGCELGIRFVAVLHKGSGKVKVYMDETSVVALYNHETSRTAWNAWFKERATEGKPDKQRAVRPIASRTFETDY